MFFDKKNSFDILEIENRNREFTKVKERLLRLENQNSTIIENLNRLEISQLKNVEEIKEDLVKNLHENQAEINELRLDVAQILEHLKKTEQAYRLLWAKITAVATVLVTIGSFGLNVIIERFKG